MQYSNPLGVCRQALRSVTWTVIANNRNQISGVWADIVLTDVAELNSTSVPTVATQEFNIEYEAESFDMTYGIDDDGNWRTAKARTRCVCYELSRI